MSELLSETHGPVFEIYELGGLNEYDFATEMNSSTSTL